MLDRPGVEAKPHHMRFALPLLCALSTLAFAGGALAESAVPAKTTLEITLTPAPKAASHGLASLFRSGKKMHRSDVPSREAVITAPPADDFIMQMPISLKRVRPPRGLG